MTLAQVRPGGPVALGKWPLAAGLSADEQAGHVPAEAAGGVRPVGLWAGEGGDEDGRGELGLLNRSAVASPDEGLEETLTLHRLGLAKQSGHSFRTTNCIENVNALLGQRTDKVDHWRNSDQKHRWLAAALLDVEPRLRRCVAALGVSACGVADTAEGCLEQVT